MSARACAWPARRARQLPPLTAASRSAPASPSPPPLHPPAPALPRSYATFVEDLESCSRDSLDFIKDRAVKTLFELLAAKAEQEGRLLAALVNKLGDPDRKLASKVGAGCVVCGVVVCGVVWCGVGVGGWVGWEPQDRCRAGVPRARADGLDACIPMHAMLAASRTSPALLRRLPGSQVGYLLTRLLAEHPGMNVPVVREIERFMFRSAAGKPPRSCPATMPAQQPASVHPARLPLPCPAALPRSCCHCLPGRGSEAPLVQLYCLSCGRYCRPGLQDRARYYAVVYLNQMVLSHKQQQQQQQQQQPGQGQGGPGRLPGLWATP